MVYSIRKEKISHRARRYGGKVWVTIHQVNTIPHTNDEMILLLKKFGYGKYAVLYPRPNWKGFKLVFRANILESGTRILFSKIEDKINLSY